MKILEVTDQLKIMAGLGSKQTKRDKTLRGIGLRTDLKLTGLIQRYPSEVRKQAFDYLFKPAFGAGLHFLQIPVTYDMGDGVIVSCESSFIREAIDSSANLNIELFLENDLVHRCLGDDGKLILDELETRIREFLDRSGIAICAFVLEDGSEPEAETVAKLLSNWILENQLSNKILIAHQDETGYRESEWSSNLNTHAKTLEKISVLDAENDDWSAEDQTSNQAKFRRNSDQIFGIGRRSLDGEETVPFFAYHLNHQIIKHGAVKIVIKNVIDSQVPGARLIPNALIVANDPALETLEIRPNLWHVAHTTQFVSPGCSLIEEECRVLPNGATVVAYQCPTSDEVTYVFESFRGNTATTINFPYRLSGRPVSVYVSSEDKCFQEDQKVIGKPRETISLLSQRVVTVSAARIQPGPRQHQVNGRRKTDRRRFRLEQRQGSTLPESLLEVAGHFALDKDSSGQPHIRHLWSERSAQDKHSQYGLLVGPCAVADEQEIGVHVLFDSVAPKRVDWVGITISVPIAKPEDLRRYLNPPGLTFRILRSSAWQITVDEMILASGLLPISCQAVDGTWTSLRVVRRGRGVLVFCNDQLVYSFQNTLRPTGLFGLASGPHDACFRFVSVS